ncbi:MAG TPA: hypothetical protein VFQ79_19870 [Bryobacteraceae bacterium]|nr:hypothetical protein [Bryobacteraceae bacterium]
MRYRFGPWQLMLGVVFLCAALIGVMFYHRSHRDLSDAELFAHLPENASLTIFIDLKSMRRAGILDMLAGSKLVEEADYQKFVERTGFDYRTDLDAVFAGFRDGKNYYLLKGRFDWNSLKRYAIQEGGRCQNGLCYMDASSSGRYISFMPLRSRVLAMTVGPDQHEARRLAENDSEQPYPDLPGAPVWAIASPQALGNSGSLPPGTRLFAKALENAEHITVSLNPQGNQFQARMRVVCRTPEDAVVLGAQLEKVTDVLRKLIQRSDQAPNPNDLSGVLTAGVFRRDNRVVYGQWPIERSFLESVAGGS